MPELEFITSRTGHQVPVFEGKALHSTVDPVTEAEKLIRPDVARLSRVNTVIILGLGGGFHVEELHRTIPGRILVIEAESDIARSLQCKNPSLMEEVAIIAGESPSTLLNEKAVIEALAQSFAFFRHPASMRQRPSYYKSVVDLFTRRTLSQLKKLSNSNISLKSFFNSLHLPENEPITLPILEEAIHRRSCELDETGKIWLLLRELVK